MRMQFGMVGCMGPKMRQVVGFWDRSTGGVILGANMGYPIVTNGDFMALWPLPKLLWDFLLYNLSWICCEFAAQQMHNSEQIEAICIGLIYIYVLHQNEHRAAKTHWVTRSILTRLELQVKPSQFILTLWSKDKIAHHTKKWIQTHRNRHKFTVSPQLHITNLQ